MVAASMVEAVVDSMAAVAGSMEEAFMEAGSMVAVSTEAAFMEAEALAGMASVMEEDSVGAPEDSTTDSATADSATADSTALAVGGSVDSTADGASAADAFSTTMISSSDSASRFMDMATAGRTTGAGILTIMDTGHGGAHTPIPTIITTSTITPARMTIPRIATAATKIMIGAEGAAYRTIAIPMRVPTMKTTMGDILGPLGLRRFMPPRTRKARIRAT